MHAAVRVLRRLAATGGTPLVLQLDDVHWADGESLDFIDHLAEVGAEIPLLVVALARPTLFERRPAPVTDGAARGRIDLAPLDEAASSQLAGELLKEMSDIPAALRERLTRSAEGNPFYMEELVKMLVDQGAIDTGGAEGSRWRLDATRLVMARLPTTLTGIVQARLDELEPDERLALQQASVIGTVFWDRTLAALDARAPLALASLCRRELLRPEPEASVEGATAFAFRHQILQQVTYDTLLRRERRTLHAAAARWFAALAEARAGDFLATTADTTSGPTSGCRRPSSTSAPPSTRASATRATRPRRWRRVRSRLSTGAPATRPRAGLRCSCAGARTGNAKTRSGCSGIGRSSKPSSTPCKPSPSGSTTRRCARASPSGAARVRFG